MDRIDLNSDIGELLTDNRDREILEIISSANICCGVHAGSVELTRRTIERASAAGVAIGAHPGIAGNFGRGRERIAPVDLYNLVAEQLSTFLRIADECSARVRHVKLHGSLYNQAESDRDSADAFIGAVAELDRPLIVYGLAGGIVMHCASKTSLLFVGELFADRSYDLSGRLTPRTAPGAVLTDDSEIAQRIVKACKSGTINSAEGTSIGVEFGTICVHGDSFRAVHTASVVRQALIHLGIQISSPAPVAT